MLNRNRALYLSTIKSPRVALIGGMKRWIAIVLTIATVPLAMAQGGYTPPALIINELLYQPRSGEAEYVELYNTSAAPLNMADYHIVRWVGDSLGKHYQLPAYTLAPRDYVVLTKDAASVMANYDVKYVSKLIECNLPTYPNTGGSVVLATADSLVVDRLDYSPSMHSPMLHNAAGVALERRSPDRPTAEVSNWFSASSLSGYGTPGYANSQSSEWLVAEAAFEFSSAVVSPDGDGYQDVLQIEYRMDNADLSADAAVYSAAGTLVAQLMNGALLGSHGMVEWNATGVSTGRYVVQIVVFDRHGTRQTIRRTVSVVAGR